MAKIETLKILTKTRGPEARAAEEVRTHALAGRFRYAAGIGWLRWDGRRWERHPGADTAVLEAVREFADRAQRQWADEAQTLRAMIVNTLTPMVVAKSGMSQADAAALVRLALANSKTAVAIVKDHGGDKAEMLQGLCGQVGEAELQAAVWL